MKSLLAAALLAAGTVGWAPGQARADLIGDTVHVTYRGPNFGTVSEDAGTQTIAAGTVFNFPVALVSITFSASQITIADTSPTGFSPATSTAPTWPSCPARRSRMSPRTRPALRLLRPAVWSVSAPTTST